MNKPAITPACEVCDSLRELTEYPSGHHCKEHKPMSAKKAGFTPGPWRILESAGMQISINGPRGETIAQVFRTFEDARLIATAPELLEACQLMLIEHYRINEQLNQRLDSLTPGMKLAKAVIARATGEE